MTRSKEVFSDRVVIGDGQFYPTKQNLQMELGVYFDIAPWSDPSTINSILG